MKENNMQNFKELEKSSNTKKTIYRWILFIVLGIFALYYITPLYVMIVTSFKTMEEIRQGNLFAFPNSINLESWDIAWNGQGFSAGDVYLKTYFWNSVKLVDKPSKCFYLDVTKHLTLVHYIFSINHSSHYFSHFGQQICDL